MMGDGRFDCDKDRVWFSLLLVLILAAVAIVLLYAPRMGSFYLYLPFAAMVFTIIWTYNMGLQRGLMAAVIFTFAYGSHLLYETMITKTISEINFVYICWLFFFPFSSMLAGRLSTIVSTYRWELENKRSLEKLVTIDAPTGLYNRQGFFRKLDEEFGRAKRYKTAFSVLLIKVVNFNELRVIYGAIDATNILKAVSEIVAKNSRHSDIQAVVAEDMIGVLLTETNDDGARIVIEKFHQALDRVTTEIRGVKKVIRIKPNIGIAYIQEGDTDALEIYDRAKEEINYDKG